MHDWQKHIRETDTQAVCGAKISWATWTFTDRAHAEAAVREQTRLQPCPDCLAKLPDSR